MAIPLTDLVQQAGASSQLAQRIIPALYQQIEHTPAAYDRWYREFWHVVPKTLKTNAVAAHYLQDTHDPFQLVFALQTYYAMVIKTLAGQRLAPVKRIEDIESGEHYRQAGLTNLTSNDMYSWYLDRMDVTELLSVTANCDFTNPIPDALKGLYHDLFPRTLRHGMGEYYTPTWFAQFVLDRINFRGERRLLDPTCGSGTFVTLAYRRLIAAGIENAHSYIAGIDINPLACLSAKANLVLNMPAPVTDTTLPIYCADVLLDPPELDAFDCIAGNPPWVNWETLPPAYRTQTKVYWEQYGLFPHSGFDAILGKGKKDLSLVLTYAVVDRYLAKGGTLGFIMTQSVLKAGGANEGFRRFKFRNSQVGPVHVDDFSNLRIFDGAATKPIVLVLTEESPDRISYNLWKGRRKTIPEDADADVITSLTHAPFIAEPVNGRGSAWITGKPKALEAVRKVIGKSSYQAHAGVYTGGANGVFWLEILERKDDLLRVRNVTAGSKRYVPEVEAWLEADLVYPFLRGRDVARWQATPAIHILMVQDPVRRQGYDIAWLQSTYPLCYAYLKQFESILVKRATYKRYFKGDVPFYTMFDIGEYTFSPYKAVWHGFGKHRMEAVVVGTVDGKPIMSNQAMHPFVGLESEDEAHFLVACVNSAPFEFAVISHTQGGGKSFAQPGILDTLCLPVYDPDNADHQQLVALSRAAHRGDIDNDAIAQASAGIWGLSQQELRELQDSLSELVD